MTFKIGKLLGIPIEVDLSWIIVFILFAYSIGVGYFSTMFPWLAPGGGIVLGIVAAMLFFATLLAHELSHCYFARKSGIPIAGITLFIFGGVARMKGEPDTPEDEFRMAIAGPLASFAFAFGFGFLSLMIGRSTVFGAILSYVAFANIMIGIFNLLPGFPLDGGRIFRSLIWKASGDINIATKVSSFTGQMIGWIMILIGVFSFIRGQQISGIWLVFIGWFLHNAAQSAYQQLIMRRAFQGILISDVMTPYVDAVSPETTVEELVENHFLHTHADTYPVIKDGSLLGIVRLDEVRAIPRSEWPRVQVTRIAKPLDDSLLAFPYQDAWDTLVKMGEQGQSTVFVVDGNDIIGSVRQEYLAKLLKLRMGTDFSGKGPGAFPVN